MHAMSIALRILVSGCSRVKSSSINCVWRCATSICMPVRVCICSVMFARPTRYMHMCPQHETVPHELLLDACGFDRQSDLFSKWVALLQFHNSTKFVFATLCIPLHAIVGPSVPLHPKLTGQMCEPAAF